MEFLYAKGFYTEPSIKKQTSTTDTERIHQNLQEEAIRIASQSDLAIIFTGQHCNTFNLPSTHDTLVSAIAATNTKTIIVNCTGHPIAMPWLDNVQAVLQAWLPGLESGNSIADILTGAINPEGRLPISFPRRLENTPAHQTCPGEDVDGQVNILYAEDVFIGYRWYDSIADGEESLNFPFGHGLSYTSFEYSEMEISMPEKSDEVVVSLNVSNIGSRSGAAVIQIYAGQQSPSAEHPWKVLVAFQKVRLDAGETQLVHLSIPLRNIAYFHKEDREWVLDEGEYVFYLGNSATEILQTVSRSLDGRRYSNY